VSLSFETQPAWGLGDKGHEVHVVTNAYEVEEEFREKLTADDLKEYQPKNVTVHNTDPFDDPFYIPYSKPYTEKIASLAIDVIREYDLELIDSWYILPYVVSGFLAKQMTNKPQIMRHAGSDMSRLLESPFLNTLFIDLFKKMDKIVSSPSQLQRFKEWGIPEEKIFFNNKVSVCTDAFNPNVKPMDLSEHKENADDLPVITYMGKVGVTKGIFELIEALGGIKEDFILLFVSNGKGIEKLKESVKEHNLEEKTIFMDFVPPWKIPSVMKASTCIVHPERDFPVAAHNPILPREVMAAGRCMMLSEELCRKLPYSNLEDGVNALIVNPYDLLGFREKLRKIIKEPDYAEGIGREALKFSREIEDFDEYIKSMEELYKEVLG